MPSCHMCGAGLRFHSCMCKVRYLVVGIYESNGLIQGDLDVTHAPTDGDVFGVEAFSEEVAKRLGGEFPCFPEVPNDRQS